MNKIISYNIGTNTSFTHLPEDIILHLSQFLSLHDFYNFCQTNHMFYEDTFTRGLAMILASNVIHSPFQSDGIIPYKIQERYVMLIISLLALHFHEYLSYLSHSIFTLQTIIFYISLDA